MHLCVTGVALVAVREEEPIILYPLYTLYTPFIAVHTPIYTRYICIYTIHTPNTPLNALNTP